ncbi:MAG TPA: PilT/PilU family type 4a pilus ATPase [Thermoanaerobaculia bacterium]|jgi:twitching motility protein PilT|nr:PilT/PilU family type 4a pilus ATPase [Thermoanaerobaculia bacterium]
MDLDRLLKFMTDKGASDLHLKPTRPPLLRINGRLLPIEAPPLKPEDLTEMLMGILSPRQKTKLEEKMSVDTGYGVRGLARFRCNIYMQRGNIAACFRRIPYQIKSLDDLELPPVLLEFCDMPMGLVLITGPTGSGKSTSLAALIRYITTHRPVHVITIEDPMEFLFTDDVASISQREVGTDTGAFSEALRNAMRQDPDVIMVGEMRDPETVSTVITAAETGHLVFSTLHTNSATQTIDRILDTFPSDQQGQVRAQLAQILKGVVSMKLVERADGQGRVAALEIMRASPKINRMVEDGETSGLLEEVESSVGYYRMQSMNQSLLALLVHGTITYAEAMRQSSDPEDLSLKLRKMFPLIEEKGGELSPTTSDFSQITELQQFKRLYEEQEEKVKLKLAEKDEQMNELHKSIHQRDEQIEELKTRQAELGTERERLKGDYARLRQEAQEKIDKLMERIKDLNQRLVGGGEAGGTAKSGIFR